MLMVFDIFFDYFFGNLVSNRSDKVTIFPKFSAPQFIPDFGKHQKNFSGRLSFQPLYYLRNRMPRLRSEKYANMIFSYLHCFYIKIIGDCYLLKTFFYKITNISSRYPIPIFCGPNQMISCIVYSMNRSSNGHANYLILLQ